MVKYISKGVNKLNMNNSQKFGIFCLILITMIYLYFSFFRSYQNTGLDIDSRSNNEIVQNENNENNENELPKKHEIKNVKIFVTDEKGNLRSVNRECDLSKETSCFKFAIKELIIGPTKWEKSKGLSSEVPSSTKILSIRESANNILVDLSGNFESGGGAESLYIRIHQLIKTVQANTKLPVYLYLNGKQADVIGGEGIMIKQPLTEKSLDD